MGFHALVGDDYTSFILGYGERKCWEVFLQNAELLEGIGRDGALHQAERYVCLLYDTPIIPTVSNHDITSSLK